MEAVVVVLVVLGGVAFERLPHFVDKDRRGDVKLLREVKKKLRAQADFPQVSLLMLIPRRVTLLSY